MAAYYDRHKAGDALFFHEFAVRWPGAAAQCVHWTFEHTLTVLFNLAPPANRRPKQQHWDGIASRCEPGLLAYISSYLGIVEPQMRWTEHLHKLIQVLGFQDPKACFASGQFQDTFRRVWSYFSPNVRALTCTKDFGRPYSSAAV